MSEGRRRQEIPTHLEVEDRVLFGLTLRQCVWLLLGVAAGYMLYAQSGQLSWPGTASPAAGGDSGALPLVLRIALGLTPLLCALVVALLQPAGRSLEDWFFALARYVTLPKRCVWRHPARTFLATIPVTAPAVETRGHAGGAHREVGESMEETVVTTTSAVIAVTAVSAEHWALNPYENNS